MLPAVRTNSLLSPFGFAPMNRLETLFDRVFGEDLASAGNASTAWGNVPVALWQDEDHIYVEAELPGIPESDLDVTVHNGMLFIRGERKPQEGRSYLFNGRTFGRFERVISLPEAVDTEQVEAHLDNGVLRVALPKRPESKPKKISLRKS